MSGTISLNIPLKSYLSKYLVQKYGSHHVVSRNSWLGNYVIELLTKQYRKNKVLQKTETYFTIEIPLTIMKESGFDISTDKLNRLEIMIEKVFRNDLESYIMVSIGCELKYYNEQFNSLNKQNVVKAIEQFLGYYSIGEDELSPETIYRDFYRSKKSDKNNVLKELRNTIKPNKA